LLAFAAVVAGVACAPALGATRSSSVCNPAGSWVASTAETNRFFQALNPTASEISVVRGAMSATFNRGRLTYGALSLTLTAKLGTTRLKEVVDLESEAPYRVRGSTLNLGAGTYSLHYISAVLYPRTGGSRPLHLPDTHIATRPISVGISCTRTRLTWAVPLPTGRGVELHFQRSP
jgi:hypothetical protein